ncbi:MAG TPA: ABC transporter permease [Acidimicrobiales bacterium]|nr:ABC transporter permease [Acidimicrobiales bacterium]
MARYVARKLAHTVAVLLLASLAVSGMLDLAPGDPAYAVLGDNATPEQVEKVHEQLGLDRPFLTRYVDWLDDVVTGDFGTSFKTGQDVTGLIVDALPVTAEIVLLTLLIAMLVAVPLGIACAQNAGGRIDRIVGASSSVLVAMPPFISVPLLAFAFVLQAQLFPATGWVDLAENPLENLHHIVLPTIALALYELPVFVAGLRTEMVSTLQQDFILNAKSKGLSRRAVLYRHALRPSSFSIVTLGGISLGRLIGGAVIVEILFVLPGIGSLSVNSINNKDIPVVQGVVMFVAITYVLVNTLIDILYGVLDPRVKAGAG